MPYLPSAVLLLIGIALLVFALVRVSRGVARARSVLAAAKATFGDESGLLRARSAALRVAVADRKRSRRVPSAGRGETGGRS
ncbi:bacteriophage holin [Actinokineospora sp. NBRC 105648]|uniref:bacteriophage holin n=1 Tax=Actinokineospora sp. NBRC 105648 TaxID=3032206 RepID=UPI002553B94B|nr:bacteriophage holin [Actinokineospora sp. NBRC 105648]